MHYLFALVHRNCFAWNPSEAIHCICWSPGFQFHNLWYLQMAHFTWHCI